MDRVGVEGRRLADAADDASSLDEIEERADELDAVDEIEDVDEVDGGFEDGDAVDEIEDVDGSEDVDAFDAVDEVEDVDEAEDVDGFEDVDEPDEIDEVEEIDGAGAPVAGEPVEDGLTGRERQVLAFERQWWRHAGAKEQAIRDQFAMSSTRYYQLLNRLLDDPAALAWDPVLVKRLRRLRATRTRARSGGRVA